MVKLLDRVFEFCSSVKLAVVVILLLAFQCAAATFYEGRYGAAAAQARVYGSPVFLLTMALLAINIMGAAVIRFPWKRKQTGFLITHLGLEVLLAGCLISYRFSVDGRVMLREGDTVEDIALRREQLGVTIGKRQWIVPVELWEPAGYPGLGRFVWQGVAGGNERVGWGKGNVVARELDKDVRLEILDWLPAAKLEQKYEEDLGGQPAVKLRVGGTTPMGQRVPDQVMWVHEAKSAAAMGKLFDGLIEVSLWKAREDAEVEEFLRVPTVEELGKLGRVTVIAGGKVYRVAVEGNVGKTVALGEGWTLAVDEYLPQAVFDSEKKKFVSGGEEPTAPVVRVRIIREGLHGLASAATMPATNPARREQEHVVSATYPFLPSRFTNGEVHGRIAKGEPVILYEHPAVIGQQKAVGGKLHLLQGSDRKLYARVFGKAGLKSASVVEVGKEVGSWVGLTCVLEEHVGAARRVEGYVPANVSAKKIDETMKAVKVALVVEGKRAEMWLPRGGGGQQVGTPMGAATVSYGYEGYRLPFKLSLVETKKENDPGTENAATYWSKVFVAERNGRNGERTITMNNPMTVAGLTFYQSGFDDQMGEGPVSFLSVRRDPGWVVKYVGSGLIVAGIFTMFYMRAYFQTPAGKKVAAEEREMSGVLR